MISVVGILSVLYLGMACVSKNGSLLRCVGDGLSELADMSSTFHAPWNFLDPWLPLQTLDPFFPLLVIDFPCFPRFCRQEYQTRRQAAALDARIAASRNNCSFILV